MASASNMSGKLEKRAQQENIESSSVLTGVITSFCYIVFIVIGKFREALRVLGFQKDLIPFEPERTQSFVSLYQHNEDFYTRQIYRRGRDCFNRPICAAAGVQTEIMQQISDNYNWSFKFTGESVRCLNMGSYNYLGFAEASGSCVDGVEWEIASSSLGSASSRQEVGSRRIHAELESELAAFLHREAALLVPMGFATNSLNLPVLVDKNSLVISDQHNHSSLILGINQSGAKKKIFKHNDMHDLERILQNAVVYGQPRTRRPYNKILIVVEGIYSMEGTVINLPEIVRLKRKYKAFVYLDEAHSIGSMGATGRGVVEHFNVDPGDIDIQMGTFTKSFGASGGYLAGRRDLIEYIRDRSHSCVYGDSMPPLVCSQILSAIRVLNSPLGKYKIDCLAWNTRYFRSALHRQRLILYGDKHSPVVPLILFVPTKCVAFGRECLRRGLAVVIVGFPACDLMTGRVRFCLSAGHTQQMLDEALAIIEEQMDLLGCRYSKRPIPKWAQQELPPRPNPEDYGLSSAQVLNYFFNKK